jgi:hypothetical protein
MSSVIARQVEINFKREEIPMNIKLRVLVTVMAGVLVGFGGPRIWAETVTVGACASGTRYKTIQAAVDAVSSGSTVNVCPGNYLEQVLITKPLTLQGAVSRRAGAAVILSPSSGLVANATSLASGNPLAAQILVQNSDGVTIQNVAVDGSDNGLTACSPILIGVYYQNASGTLNRVVTRNQTLETRLNGCQSGLGIFADSGNGGQSTVTIENSSIRAYQKTGITGNEPGTNIIITANTVVGQGPTEGAGQNGIQIGFGATGEISRNSVIDHVFAPGTVSAAGILVVSSTGVRILSNTVGAAQGGIVVFSDPNFGPADYSVIERNTVFGAQNIDGIELCSNNNTVALNQVNNSSDTAIHLDSSCGSTGNNNTVLQNLINEACVGILRGSGTTGNLVNGNTFANVIHTLLQAEGCPDIVPAKTDLVSAKSAVSIKPRSVGTRHNISPARP